jgi:DNA repair protein RecN (Recombination protein N)
MLTELRITNFAVIEQLTLEFSPGFHVLTGETGAGKSILVDALALLVGGRPSIDQIRSDTEEAVLEAAFVLPPQSPLTAALKESGLLGPTDTELLVRRVLSRSGRHRLYLNGNLAPVHQLQSLAGTLVDIHGQHEQQSLLSAQTQLDAIDAFGHLRDLREAYGIQYTRWRTNQHELEQLERLGADRVRQEELLRFQYQELEQAALRPGEEEGLHAERQRLLHGRKLDELAAEAYEALYGGEPSVTALLGAINNRLRELRDIDASTDEWRVRCEGAAVELRELAQSLREYRERLDQDADRLHAIEERWDRLQRLKKKYAGEADGKTGDAIHALLAHQQQLKEQLEQVGRVDERLTKLRDEVRQQAARMRDLGRELTDKRTAAARKMESRVKAELAGLHMGQTRFKVELSQADGATGCGPTGGDRAEYLLSANAGEPLQPLARVASGGELSRVMLAIKTVLAETDRVPVLIFDEVDAGIGGAVATVMGRRLRELSKFHQVFCITHLPQIASQARHHVLVEKTVIKKRTVTHARRLDDADRREEIARMLAGAAITRSVRETAAEMIGHGDES